MKLFKVLLCLSLFAAPAQALTLQELQEMALQSRAVIQKYQVNLEKSRHDQTIAKSAYLPSVDLSYTLNALDNSSFLENKENSVAAGAVSINVFSGFKDKYTIESAELLARAEKFKLKGLEQDIMLNVALRHLAIYDRQANLQVAKDAYETLTKIYQDAENRFKVGLIDKNELLRFKVDLDNAQIVMKKAHAELAKSVRLLSREVDTAIKLEEISFDLFENLPAEPDVQVYEEKMYEQRSDVQVLEELIAVSENSVKIAQSSRLPSVDLTGSYRNYDDNYINTQGSGSDDEVRAQVVVSLNIFDGWRKPATIGKAMLDVQAAQYDLAELKSDLDTQLQNLLLDFGVSLSNTVVARTGIEQAEENLRITRLRYQEGIETESDLLDAITNLSRAHSNLISAKTEVFSNNYRLTRLVEAF